MSDIIVKCCGDTDCSGGSPCCCFFCGVNNGDTGQIVLSSPNFGYVEIDIFWDVRTNPRCEVHFTGMADGYIYFDNNTTSAYLVMTYVWSPSGCEYIYYGTTGSFWHGPDGSCIIHETGFGTTGYLEFDTGGCPMTDPDRKAHV